MGRWLRTGSGRSLIREYGMVRASLWEGDDAGPAAMNIAWTWVRLASRHGHEEKDREEDHREEEAGAGRSAQAAGESAAPPAPAQTGPRAQARSAAALPGAGLCRQRQARRDGR